MEKQTNAKLVCFFILSKIIRVKEEKPINTKSIFLTGKLSKVKLVVYRKHLRCRA